MTTMSSPYSITPLQYDGPCPAATRQAIVKYARYMRDQLFEPEPNMLEMRLVVEHCADVINSPWLIFPPELVAELRSSIEHVKLPRREPSGRGSRLANWLWGRVYPAAQRGAQIGIDPL